VWLCILGFPSAYLRELCCSALGIWDCCKLHSIYAGRASYPPIHSQATWCFFCCFPIELEQGTTGPVHVAYTPLTVFAPLQTGPFSRAGSGVRLSTYLEGASYKSEMCNLRAGSGPRRSYIQPSEKVKKYKKFLPNDRDFMNEFKLHWTINNFASYYNPKQLWWQQYQITSNKRAS